MPQHLRRRPRLAALAATIALAGAGLAGTAAFAAPAAAAPASGGAAIDTVDYLADTYGLEDSPIETVTFERFEWLLNQPGRFAFLIGGPADARTTETIASIDAAAKAAGVERVYAFDPRLDGAALDLRTTTNPDVAPLWARLVSQYLGKDVQTPFGGAADPYFFVYDRSHTDGGAEDRIVSALTAPVAAGALADPAARAAYRAEVAAAIGDGAAIDALSQFAFADDVIDAKHLAQYRGGEAYGPNTIIDEADADWRIQTITYPELVHLLDRDGDYVLFFGGTWCHNTRAVLKDVNRQAVANGVSKVYFFDLRLDGASANDLHIRDTNSDYAHLYGDLVTTYLPNLKTQYVPGVSGQVDYRPGGDAAAGLVSAKKLQVPYVFEYQRGRTVDGQAAPVVREWIRDNGDGTFKEYMTEWWYVNDREGRFATSPDPVKLAEQLAFADEAIAQLDAFFAKVGTGDGTGGPVDPVDPEPTDPTTVKGTVAVTGQLRPGGTVTVEGADLATGTAGFSVELHSAPQQLGTVSTDASGAFRLTATIPAATPAGAHTVLVLINGVTVASTPVTITATNPGGTAGGTGGGSAGASSGSGAGTGTDASGLASTGTGFVDVLGWSALGLLAAGLAAFLLARRRRLVR
ncbi:hypothetical protein M3147_11870 [Agromyces mediolanus]|uniref:hypothetical protein n=1 Tax=Agromyces mediolanus TaxID=41986 RepID=UPI002041093D|nr:hypothetical protein [Agromyces mediolanus]MCM3657948.1 hypothetical protein [Agromyces mediolanus]